MPVVKKKPKPIAAKNSSKKASKGSVQTKDSSKSVSPQSLSVSKTFSSKKPSKKKTFYVTTAIDYVNAEPHIGHAYQKIVADVLARWHRLLGEDVFFLTGTDEHGKKVANSAIIAGKSPKEFVDEIAAKFKEAWVALDIVPDRFIRTTDKDHIGVVKEFIEGAIKSGDVY
ncbi:MAG: class I tRNA ligase family protein, partial [Candidatus Diapherotrites archaeon]|nr:class I tRNA ligase family protein [Candidatus Diapherotrites archaeon]